MESRCERFDRFVRQQARIDLFRPFKSKDGHLIVLDASFNPPHLAHQELVKIATQQYSDASVLFALSTSNADKGDGKREDYGHRLGMLDGFVVDTEEALGMKDRIGYGLINCPRFVDKLSAVRQVHSQGEVVFVVGYDTLVRILDQKYYEQPLSQALQEFMEQCRLQVLTRKPDQESKTPESVDSDLDKQLEFISNISKGLVPNVPRQWADKITVVKSTDRTEGVSSSLARKLSKSEPNTLAKLVTPRVLDYIQASNPY